jgi:hypothetical protein
MKLTSLVVKFLSILICITFLFYPTCARGEVLSQTLLNDSTQFSDMYQSTYQEAYGSLFSSKLNPTLLSSLGSTQTDNSLWLRQYIDQTPDPYYGTNTSIGFLSVQPTLDGGYIMSGWISLPNKKVDNLIVVKANAAGNMEWKRIFPDYGSNGCVYATPDGGYLIAGSSTALSGINYEGYIIKLDSNGEFDKQKFFVSPGGLLINQFLADNAGNYYVIGNTGEPPGGRNDIFVLKLDGFLNIVWQKAYGWPGWNDPVTDGLISTDGGLILVGGAFLWKIDPNGYLLWIKYIDSTELFRIVHAKDGGLFIAGDARDGGHYRLVKLSGEFEVEWDKSYFDSPDFIGYQGITDVAPLDDGGAIIAASSGWLARVNSNGSIKWQEITNINYGYKILLNSDGTFVLTGSNYIAKFMLTGESCSGPPLPLSISDHDMYDPNIYHFNTPLSEFGWAEYGTDIQNVVYDPIIENAPIVTELTICENELHSQPTITYQGRTSANENGWNNSSVTVNWSCGNAILDSISTTVDSEGYNQSTTGICTGSDGDTASDTQTGINIDKTQPIIVINGVADGNKYFLGAVPTASCTATDSLSEVDGLCSIIVTGDPADGVGPHSFIATATDKAGNIAIQNGGYTVVPALTTLGPARVWIGLKNSDDVGTKFDLLAEILQNGTLVGSGQLNSVPGGSSGFNNANLFSIPLNLFSPVEWPQNSLLSVRLSVRNTCYGHTHNSGTARLWYNDTAANSSFNTTIAGSNWIYYLLNGFVLGNSPGPGPRKYVDIQAGSPCSPFKLFGTWSIMP